VAPPDERGYDSHMPSHLRRYDEPGHTHYWTISCYRRLQFFHDDGMKRFYEFGDPSVLSMDWDGRWPIEW